METHPFPLVPTPNALARIRQLAEKKGIEPRFRVGISGGGCSGFQYEMGLDHTPRTDDITTTHEGITLVTDEISIPFLKDAVLDYVETLASAGFEIKNPNVSASCGCGNSFAV